MAKLREWTDSDDLSQFQPLRMTITGAGGSGKSVVINTIVTLMRKMFQYDGVVRVAAPTGTAAFNVGGETFHHLTGSKPSNAQYRPNAMNSNKEKRKKLIKKFQILLALIIDERSLATSKDLGTTNRLISETIFGGGPFSDESWGGLPIVILLGDDYQLPGVGEGALRVFDSVSTAPMTLLGKQSFLECAKTVMTLKGSKRIKEDQKDDKELIDAIRVQADLSDVQVQKLMNLNIKEYERKFGMEARREIEAKSIHLFFKNEKRIKHNLERLFIQSSAEQPVAIIKAKGYSHTTGKADARHYDNDAPSTSLICEGAKVALDSKNFCPLWGLHNGACGTVTEIVFEQGKNPNHGDMPLYVVVDFPLYCGPVWDIDNPKSVPIPLSTYNCKFSSPGRCCCNRTFLPLCLAYARTIHKFQGMSAGPVDEGKIPNMFECIVCDPDDRHQERTALGLFYTGISRATTLGNFDGKGSAIYFDEDFNEDRVRNIGKKNKTDEDYMRFAQRNKWVKHLNSNIIHSSMSKQKRQEILQWSETFVMDQNKLYTRIQTYIRQKEGTGEQQRKKQRSK